MRSAALATLLCAGALAALVTQPAAASATISVRPMFPSDNLWNVPVDTLPVDANSNAYVTTIGATKLAHPDFGTVYAGAPNGIPFVVVSGAQPRVAVSFDYAGESDPGPYPIPPDAPIEGGPQSTGDRHVLVVDRDGAKLYELFAAYPNPDGSWHAGSGAVFDLTSNALRPATWTSADAAGLPILPGLVRYEEVFVGEIDHALRFTAPQTRNTYIWPARHKASSLTGLNYPPMGQRFRLKASVDISTFGPNVQRILRALKKYGMFLADNGSSWYISGAPDPRWDDNELHQLSQLHGSDFEAVDESSLMVDPNSGQTRPPAGLSTPATVTAVEFYCAHTDRYLMSVAAGEIAMLGSARFPGWVRTGQSFAIFAATVPPDATHPATCRACARPAAMAESRVRASPGACDAVFGQFPNELLGAAGAFVMALPNAADGSCAAGTVPVYRLYDNRPDGNYRYTESMPIRDQMLAAGWISQGLGALGVVMCAPASY
jgi:hypothetical protein